MTGFAVCPKCSHQFRRDKEWKKICYACYMKEKTPSPKPREIELLRLHVRLLEARLAERDEPSGPPASTLKWMLSRMHPDKNPGSEHSAEATRWLLTLRGTGGGGGGESV